MTGDQIPVLPRGVRVQADPVRGQTVLLGPERTLVLDEIGVAILGEVDGTRNLADIAGRLAERYAAPAAEIEADVAMFLRTLAERRLLEVRDA